MNVCSRFLPPPQAHKDSGDAAAHQAQSKRIGIAKMYGYALGAAKAGLWHKWGSDFMVYPMYEPTGALSWFTDAWRAHVHAGGVTAVKCVMRECLALGKSCLAGEGARSVRPGGASAHLLISGSLYSTAAALLHALCFTRLAHRRAAHPNHFFAQASRAACTMASTTKSATGE